MKKILLILLMLPVAIVAQEKEKKNQKVQFTVHGNCEMCEKRIEKAALETKGVKMADWDISSNQISLIFNPKKVSLQTIHDNIAAQGHDTSGARAKEEDYEQLPMCCQYERKE